MKVEDDIFRKYDIRGIVNEDLTADFARNLGLAFGSYLKRNGFKELVVGQDVRKSSPWLFESLTEGITDTGCNVLDIGMVPTPLMYFTIFHFDMDGGIMITGSHNPIDYNGFKMMKGKDTLYGDEIQTLKKLILREDYEKGKGKIEKRDIKEEYLEHVLSLLSPSKNLKIVLDPGNGTAGPVSLELYKRLGADVECINCEPDGTFPNHLPDPTVVKYTRQLSERVKETGADMGMGYDGDSDRIGIVDEKGNLVFGDQLLGAMTKQVLEREPGAQVLFDVKCSQGLIEWIEKLGGEPVMWKTGHSLLKAKMKEIECPIAGEMSGHIFLGDNYYGFDDAIFVSARFYELVSNSSKTVSEIISEMPYYESTPEIRTEVTEEMKWKIVEDVRKKFEKEYKTIQIDGVRILFNDGWGLVRASNTQPVVVTRFEAKTPERLKEIKEMVHGYMNERKEYYS